MFTCFNNKDSNNLLSTYYVSGTVLSISYNFIGTLQCGYFNPILQIRNWNLQWWRNTPTVTQLAIGSTRIQKHVFLIPKCRLHANASYPSNSRFVLPWLSSKHQRRKVLDSEQTGSQWKTSLLSLSHSHSAIHYPTVK